MTRRTMGRVIVNTLSLFPLWEGISIFHINALLVSVSHTCPLSNWFSQLTQSINHKEMLNFLKFFLHRWEPDMVFSCNLLIWWIIMTWMLSKPWISETDTTYLWCIILFINSCISCLARVLFGPTYSLCNFGFPNINSHLESGWHGALFSLFFVTSGLCFIDFLLKFRS